MRFCKQKNVRYTKATNASKHEKTHYSGVKATIVGFVVRSASKLLFVVESIG